MIYFKEVTSEHSGILINVEVEEGTTDICLSQEGDTVMIMNEGQARALVAAIRKASKKLGWYV